MVPMPHGVVKFFNAAKGYGFISPDEGGGDIFVHVSAVERACLGGLNDGDQVSYEIEHDRRSGKPSAVDLEVLGFAPVADRRPNGGGASRPGEARRDPSARPPNRQGADHRAATGSGSGVVKWFNPTKGFGFIQPSDGGGDVFVHISAVERAGLRTLDDGQAVSYDIEQDRRTGKSSATNLRLGG
jgi:CspA family cold shock protein